MAVFLIAYKKTSISEGGYSNDSADTGGETWKGIARNKHPNWIGWGIIDAQKKLPNFPKNMNTHRSLESEVQNFYIKNFWKVIKGDELISQVIADSLYDSAVNMGPKQAIKLAQRAMKIPETGVMDPLTFKTVNV